ncbi:MAG: helix-turn-helix domain-containing protein [Sporichthyaceae bacterium]
MGLAFRNVDVDPDAPVHTWPSEAVATALSRGGLSHWRRLAEAIRADPWGPVARRVEEAVQVQAPYGAGPLMTEVLRCARADSERRERAVVAAELTALVGASGLTRAQFASRLGTSASRLSTYLSGRVVPSAALMVRARNLAKSPARDPNPRGG